MNRTCGGCTACCKTHGIQELNKTPGIYCQFCVEGSGCGIYKNRPFLCQGFQCEWLRGTGPEKRRPDKLGIVQEIREAPNVGTGIWLWEVEEKTLQTEYVRKLTIAYIQRKIPVMHVPLTERALLFLPQHFKGLYFRFQREFSELQGVSLPYDIAMRYLRVRW